MFSRISAETLCNTFRTLQNGILGNQHQRDQTLSDRRVPFRSRRHVQEVSRSELDDGDWEKDGAASVGEIMGEVECSKRTIEKGDKVSEKVLDDVVMMLGCCADDIQGEKITDAR